MRAQGRFLKIFVTLAVAGCSVEATDNQASLQVHVSNVSGRDTGGSNSETSAGLYVEDENGNAVALSPDTTTLKAEVLSGDGVWRTVAASANLGQAPRIDTVLVAAASGSEAGSPALVQEAAADFAQQLLTPAHDNRVGLVRVSTLASIAAEMSAEPTLLDAAIADLPSSSDQTALYDGLRLANQTLERSAAGKEFENSCLDRTLRSIVVLTHGRDNSSAHEHAAEAKREAETEATALDQLAELQVLDSKTPIFALGIGDSLDTRSLRKLADTTSGRYTAVGDYSTLLGALHSQAARLKNYVPFCIQQVSCEALSARITVTVTRDQGNGKAPIALTSSTEFEIPPQNCSE